LAATVWEKHGISKLWHAILKFPLLPHPANERWQTGRTTRKGDLARSKPSDSGSRDFAFEQVHHTWVAPSHVLLRQQVLLPCLVQKLPLKTKLCSLTDLVVELLRFPQFFFFWP
jgi:hypothetical protein